MSGVLEALMSELADPEFELAIRERNSLKNLMKCHD